MANPDLTKYYFLRPDGLPDFGQRLQLISSWKARAIVATRGNQTFLGCVVLAILGKAPDNPPRIVGAAEINKDGVVIAPVQFRDMAKGQSGITALCTAEQLRDDFRRLGDYLKLSDQDRGAMNFELRAWIKLDQRAVIDIGHGHNIKEV